MIGPVPAQQPVNTGGLMDRTWLNFFQKLALLLSGYESGFLSGTGTPEAVVVAPVGTLFRRTDGGASTTLYVKESGTGNTGWVPK